MSSSVAIDQAVQRLVLMGSADEAATQCVYAGLLNSGQACQFVTAATLLGLYETLRQRAPNVVLLDDRVLGNASLEETLLRITEFAPLVLVAAPETGGEASRWIARGDVEFIARVGDFAPVAVAMMIRRMRSSEQADALVSAPGNEFPADFAAILRHEINNPLTGILGNAELLLAHYGDKLPVAALQRIETVVDLAVRLRESTRRLGNTLDSDRQAVSTP